MNETYRSNSMYCAHMLQIFNVNRRSNNQFYETEVCKCNVILNLKNKIENWIVSIRKISSTVIPKTIFGLINVSTCIFITIKIGIDIRNGRSKNQI